MGDTGDQPCIAQGSSVIRMRQGTVPRRQAPTGRGFGTGFSHTVEFSRNVAGVALQRLTCGSRGGHRRSGGTVPRAFQERQRLPTCPASVLLVEHHPPRRHLHTEAPPCRPDHLGVRTATEQPSDESSWRSATPCLPVPAPWASAGEVLGLEELPCLQLGEGSTGFDSVSTWCHRLETSNHNGS